MKIINPAEIDPTIRIANYFETKPNDNWGPRTIPDWEIILVVSGRFSYETGDGNIVLRAGDVLLIPPAVSHTFRRINSRGKAVISCIHGEMMTTGTWAGGNYRLEPAPQTVTHIGGQSFIKNSFREAARLFEGYDRYRQARLKSIVRLIWLTLAEYWQEDCRVRFSPRMEEMIRFLKEHLADPVSRLDLARHFDLTPQHINAVFKRELGLSPTQFIHRERVMLAYRYIQIDKVSVLTAAERVGFSDQFYFSKVFKKIMGFSPSRC